MFRTAACLVVLSFAGLAPADGPSTRESLVVSAADLAADLGAPDLVLLHVGDRAEYEQAHLPGARFVSLSDLSVSDRSGEGLHLEMLPADLLRERLEALGISDRSRIVVYFGKDWLSPTTRVIFTLDYAGLGDRTRLLDGGQEAWVRDGHAVTADVPAVRSGSLSPLSLKQTVVDAAFVRAHLATPGFAIVDARDPDFYGGQRTGGGGDRKHLTGHIRGAASVPFSAIVDDAMRLRPADELRGLFEAAGVKRDDTVVTYCHIGQQATATLFAARTLGYRTLLYDGSFEDWSRQPDAPVDTRK